MQFYSHKFPKPSPTKATKTVFRKETSVNRRKQMRSSFTTNHTLRQDSSHLGIKRSEQYLLLSRNDEDWRKSDANKT